MKKKIGIVFLTLLGLVLAWLAIMFIPGKTDSIENYPKDEREFIKDALQTHYYQDHFPSGVRIFRKAVYQCEDKSKLSYEIWFRSYNFMNQVVGKGMVSKDCYSGGSGYRGGFFFYPNQR